LPTSEVFGFERVMSLRRRGFLHFQKPLDAENAGDARAIAQRHVRLVPILSE
jgi:hypothetical protein